MPTPKKTRPRRDPVASELAQHLGALVDLVVAEGFTITYMNGKPSSLQRRERPSDLELEEVPGSIGSWTGHRLLDNWNGEGGWEDEDYQEAERDLNQLIRAVRVLAENQQKLKDALEYVRGIR